MVATRRHGLAAAACAALLAGCGSTAVPPGPAAGAADGGVRAAPQGGGAELGGFGSAARSSRGQTAPGLGLQPADAAAALVPAAAEERGRPGREATTASRDPQRQGPLRVGVLMLEGDAAGMLAAMALEADAGDVEGALRAVVADINRRGGAAGRRLEMVVHRMNATAAAENPPLAADRACRRLTEDEQVHVALSGVTVTSIPTLFSCLAKHDVPLMAVDPNPHSQRSEFEPFARHLYHPSTVVLERLAPTWVRRLVARRYFSSWDTTVGAPGTAPLRVGVVQQAGNEFYGRSVRAALRAHGLPAPEVVTYSDFDDASQRMSSYVLRLKEKGITHVFVDKPLSTIFFLIAAEAQVYRPRYALTTFNGPTLGLANQKSVPKQQLRGALGVGFLPLVDVTDPAIDRQAGSMAHRCEAAARAAGVKPAHDNFSRQAQLVHCEGLLLMARAYDIAGAATARALQRGMEQAGLRAVATHPGVAIRAGRHDGVAFVRDLAYVEATGHFVYVGAPHRLPT